MSVETDIIRILYHNRLLIRVSNNSVIHNDDVCPLCWCMLCDMLHFVAFIARF